MSNTLDLVIKNAKVATASDVFMADIGIKDGTIVMLGSHLPDALKTIDAAGRVVTPVAWMRTVIWINPCQPP